jgi:rare lipoprotein A (peptidoglycan hydrolase)
MIKVLATREGLEGRATASGFHISNAVSFVALPSVKALGRHVRVTNPKNGRSVIAQVLDVGPWNEMDDNYVFGQSRPAAESGISVSGKGTNKAGIDLGEFVWKALGLTDNAEVEWTFLV